MTYPEAVRRAGHADGNALFEAILTQPFGRDVHRPRVRRRLRADHPRRPAGSRSSMPEMLDGVSALLAHGTGAADHRRVPDRAVGRASGAPTPPTTSSAIRPGASATPTARCGSASRTPTRSAWSTAAARASPPRRAAPRRPSRSATRCCPGTRRCPTASASTHVDADGHAVTPGVAPNALTSTQWRDAYAGTPWHKHVPARIDRVVEHASVRRDRCQPSSSRVARSRTARRPPLGCSAATNGCRSPTRRRAVLRASTSSASAQYGDQVPQVVHAAVVDASQRAATVASRRAQSRTARSIGQQLGGEGEHAGAPGLARAVATLVPPLVRAPRRCSGAPRCRAVPSRNACRLSNW